MSDDLWLQISSGQGPAECQWVVAELAKVIAEAAAKERIEVAELERKIGDERNTAKSILLRLSGDDPEAFVDSWTGTVKWIGQSAYRPRHRRKNWFVGVTPLRPPTTTELDEQDVRIETMRSGGPGGQHANTSNTAVRATHLPTGTTAVAQEERSQIRNRSLAMARLADALASVDAAASDASRTDRRRKHLDLERGNPIRTFRGERFRQV